MVDYLPKVELEMGTKKLVCFQSIELRLIQTICMESNYDTD